MPLLRTTLFVAAALTTVYLMGFLFVLIGNPVNQFANVLDLMRSVAMTSWVVWAIFRTGDRILKGQRKQHMTEFAKEIGMNDPGRADLRAVR